MIERDFFRQSPLECSRELVGTTLQWGELAGIIVETEAYDNEGDPACHTFFRPSTRTFVEKNEAGVAYVYLNYGVHWMLNVLVKGKRTGFVLIRAIHPKAGIEAMQANRKRSLLTELCSGPGKLTQAFGIRGSDHGRDLCTDTCHAFYIGVKPQKLHQCTRIGISVAMDYPWRFVVADSPYLSVPIPSETPRELIVAQSLSTNERSRTSSKRKRSAKSPSQLERGEI